MTPERPTRRDFVRATGTVLAGLHVAPGFIDIHTHSDFDILLYPTADSRVRQGVTTELAGNCGMSAAPLAGASAEARRREHREAGVEASWTGVASYCDALDKAGMSVNQALLVGQGTIRTNTIGNIDRRLNADELAAVLRAVEAGMDEGAFGLSTGLEYTPGRYTPTDEIVAMARAVGRRGGLYASHIRNEETTLLEAVDEAITIGRQSGARDEMLARLRDAGWRTRIRREVDEQMPRAAETVRPPLRNPSGAGWPAATVLPRRRLAVRGGDRCYDARISG